MSKILIVNSDQDMIDILEMIFIHQQYKVNIFDSKADISEYSSVNKPDVIITGYSLNNPQYSTLYKQLRDREQTNNIPIIFLSDRPVSIATSDNNICNVNPLNLSLLSTQVKYMLKKTIPAN